MTELPPGWTIARFEELLTFGPRNGYSPRAVEYPTETRTLTLTATTSGKFNPNCFKYVDEHVPSDSHLWLSDGDILIQRANTLEYVGVSALYRGPEKAFIYPDLIMRSRVDDSMDARFVHRALSIEPVRAYFRANATGTAGSMPKINQPVVRGAPIPLAPSREQTRIADKLDALLARVDACRERLDRVPAVLKRFRQSVLAAATSGELTREWREERGEVDELQSFQLDDAEPFRDYSFPASWTARRLAEVATIVGGMTKDSKKQAAEFTELPYLRVANVQRGYLDLSEVKTIRVPPERVAELLLRAGDILFNEGGDIDKLGRGWIWSGELPACVFQNHVFRARLLDASFEPRYFSWYGNSRGYDYFLARGKQTTNLASINKSVLSALPVAVPPTDEQAEIVRRTTVLLDLADHLERRCETGRSLIAELTPSLLAKAFRGELVPQDPNDEPASALLERIRGRPQSTGKGVTQRRGDSPRILRPSFRQAQ